MDTIFWLSIGFRLPSLWACSKLHHIRQAWYKIKIESFDWFISEQTATEHVLKYYKLLCSTKSGHWKPLKKQHIVTKREQRDWRKRYVPQTSVNKKQFYLSAHSMGTFIRIRKEEMAAYT